MASLPGTLSVSKNAKRYGLGDVAASAFSIPNSRRSKVNAPRSPADFSSRSNSSPLTGWSSLSARLPPDLGVESASVRPPRVEAEDEGNRGVHEDTHHAPRRGGGDPEYRHRGTGEPQDRVDEGMERFRSTQE